MKKNYDPLPPQKNIHAGNFSIKCVNIIFFMYTCICLHTHARTRTQVHTRTHARTHAYAHTHTRTHACTHARTHAHRTSTLFNESTCIFNVHVHSNFKYYYYTKAIFLSYRYYRGCFLPAGEDLVLA